jgi:outer membrane usher protein
LLAPGVTFQIDTISAAIRIYAEPGLLETSRFDMSRRRPVEAVHSGSDSGFLNYGVFYDRIDDSGIESINIPIEVGFSSGNRLFLSSFSHTRRESSNQSVRLMSNLTVDSIDRQRQLIVGDFSTFTGVLGSGGIFGGLSIARNFSITPWFIRSPQLSISGIIETPSELEIYVGDRLVDTRRAAPGGFELLNVPNSGGAGDVTLVVRDVFGRESIYEHPFYLSTNLLRAGLHEYSYNLGFRRQKFGLESFEYGDLTFLGFHRIGVTDSLTMGLRGEASGDVQSFGAGVSFASEGFGEMAVSVSGSHDSLGWGYAGSLSYLYRGSYVSPRLELTGFSKKYATLNLSSNADKPRLAAAFGLGYRPIFSGSASIQYSVTDNYLGQDTRRLSLSYTRRVFRTASLFIRASRIRSAEQSDEIFAGITVPIGPGSSAGMNLVKNGQMRMATGYFSKNAPPDVGPGYRLQVDAVDDRLRGTTVNGNGMLMYRDSLGVLFAEYRHTDQLNSYRLGASGALALIDRSLHLSRPIRDSYALVKVADIEGVNVRQSNQVVGVTNSKGEILVPNLISYYDNYLSIDARAIPVSYAISEVAQYVAPPLRGGVVVRFGVNKIQAFVGRLFVLSEGKRVPAEYWGLQLDLPDAKVEALIGRNAEFYLENIPAGKWPARLFTSDRLCLFSLSVPQSDDTVVDMGDVTCEID